MRQHFFGDPPGAPGMVQRSTIIFEKLCQTLSLFSEIKKLDFHYVTWVILQGWDLGLLGVNIFIFFKHGRVAYQIKGDGEQNGIQVKCSSYGHTCDLEV